MATKRPWKVFVQSIGPSFSFSTEEKARARALALSLGDKELGLGGYSSVLVWHSVLDGGNLRERWEYREGVCHRQVLEPGHGWSDAKWEPTELPATGLTVDQARSKLSGWHFAKECLSDGERDILHVAEGLLRLIDAGDPRGYAR